MQNPGNTNRGEGAGLRLLFLAMAAALLPASAADAPAKPGLARNVVADYAADNAFESGDLMTVLQKAVDEVGAAGGGTVVIPGRAGGGHLARPVFVGYPNVTVAGDGAATRINGGGTLFILGMRVQDTQPLSAGHRPLITGESGVFDASVTGARYGLRTFDGKVRAAGYFPACPLAFGCRVPRDPSGDYWKDYAAGSGKPTYWQNWPQYTLNLAVRNNGPDPMKGTVCGVGAGGVSPELTSGTIADPLNVWTIESEARTGDGLAFKFKVTDKDGRESVRRLLLSKPSVGPGTHRISVQLDFTTGRCQAWYSASAAAVAQPVLVSILELGEGFRLKAFEYGAFQFGPVTGRNFSGTPHDGTSGNDLTLCGLGLFNAPRYRSQEAGTAQKRLADDQPVNDRDRFFPDPNEPGLVSFLPLTDAAPEQLVAYRNAQHYDGATGFGFWLAERRLEPIGGTITLRAMHLFANSSNCGMTIAVGEARHVVLENIYEGGGGYHGVGSLHCAPAESVLELRNCRLVGWDAALYAHGQTLIGENVSGGSGETIIRLVGCQGKIDNFLVTGFLAADYYVKIHAGARGGPLRFSQFCIDNEGMSFVPRKACFYAEPSLDGGKDGNVLSFPGTLYTGALNGGQAVVELAEPPGKVGRRVTGRLEIDGVDLMSDGKRPAGCIVLCRSDRWSGEIRLAQTSWIDALNYGVIRHTGVEPCRIVSLHTDASAVPAKGTWLAGAHVFRIAERLDPATGAAAFKTWRCVKTGTYGSGQAPEWREVKP